MIWKGWGKFLTNWIKKKLITKLSYNSIYGLLKLIQCLEEKWKL